MMKSKTALITLCALMLLSGCKPSDSDVKAAVQQQIVSDLMAFVSGLGTKDTPQQMQDAMNKSASSLTIDINNDVEQADGSYIATYTLTPPAAHPDFLGFFHLAPTGTIHFLKGSNGLVVEQDASTVTETSD